MENRKYTLEEIQNCIKTLEALVGNSEPLICLSKQEKRDYLPQRGK